MKMPHLLIDGRRIAEDAPPYVIAEAGVHHANSVELARRYILEAAIAGADAIKFQTYSADRLAARWAPTYWDAPAGLTQHDIFASRSLLGLDAYQALFAYAQELGITLLSTPFDPDAATLLAGFDMAAYKIASADLTHLPLLEAVAVHGKPVLLSTGASTFAEIDTARDLLMARGAQVSLLHCVLSYPTPLPAANLARITALRARYADVVLGYSDHTRAADSLLPCSLAVALGARIEEKHFTLNTMLDGDDHNHAVDPAGLKQLVRDCADAWHMVQPGGELAEVESPARKFARRSIVAAHALEPGTRLSEADLEFKRPGTGLSPARVDEVLGRTLTKALEADALVTLDDLAKTSEG